MSDVLALSLDEWTDMFRPSSSLGIPQLPFGLWQDKQAATPMRCRSGAFHKRHS